MPLRTPLLTSFIDTTHDASCDASRVCLIYEHSLKSTHALKTMHRACTPVARAGAIILMLCKQLLHKQFVCSCASTHMQTIHTHSTELRALGAQKPERKIKTFVTHKFIRLLCAAREHISHSHNEQTAARNMAQYYSECHASVCAIEN